MNPTEHPESSIVARLVVAVVALSSLAAGTATVGSVFAVVAEAPASNIESDPSAL